MKAKSIKIEFDEKDDWWQMSSSEGIELEEAVRMVREAWEDYKPKEPLIKDEKVRKAVRLWAEVNSIEGVIYDERFSASLCNLIDAGDDAFDIGFVGRIPTLKDGDTYSIAQLCGEEE